MKEQFTLTFYSEEQMALINKTAVIFSRRKITIESLNISTCEISGMYRFTIVVTETSETARNLALQIEKIIDVYKCYYQTNLEIAYTQTALYKVSTDTIVKESVNDLIQKYNMRFVTLEKEYTILEATAREKEIDCLTALLTEQGLIEFVKSPRIALIKSKTGFEEELQHF